MRNTSAAPYPASIHEILLRNLTPYDLYSPNVWERKVVELGLALLLCDKGHLCTLCWHVANAVAYLNTTPLHAP
jgi:hypothetical protein